MIEKIFHFRNIFFAAPTFLCRRSRLPFLQGWCHVFSSSVLSCRELLRFRSNRIWPPAEESKHAFYKKERREMPALNLRPLAPWGLYMRNKPTRPWRPPHHPPLICSLCNKYAPRQQKLAFPNSKVCQKLSFDPSLLFEVEWCLALKIVLVGNTTLIGTSRKLLLNSFWKVHSQSTWLDKSAQWELVNCFNITASGDLYSLNPITIHNH